MSKTPRTDEQAGALIDAEEVVPAYFCRELEIELNEQVLLNGKGSEREYSLLGKIERLERENAALTQKNSEWESERLQFANRSKKLHRLEEENTALKASIKDMLHAADDLGIYPAATIQPDGTEVKRTSQQEGYNEAVMTLGSALDLIAAKHKIEVDENREDPWCWSKPLANLQNLIEQLKREKLELLSNNQTEEYICVDREHGLWKRKDKTL